MDSIKEALEYLVSLGNPPRVEVEGREYSAVELNPIIDPQVHPVQVHTLTGLTDYLSQNEPIEEMIDRSKLIVHVESPSRVNLFSFLDPKWKGRDYYINVVMPNGDPYPFGRYLPIDEFNTQLQSRFVQNDTTKEILKSTGNITSSVVQTVEDDGTSQKIHVKIGINRNAEAIIPNPVTLCPYRTFNEVEQPASKFVLRLKQGDEKTGTMPTAALFQADGGQWELEAILKIKEWLQAKLPDIMIIA